MSGQPASGGTPRRPSSVKRAQAGKRGGKTAKKAAAKKKPAARKATAKKPKAKTGRASTTHGGPPRTDYAKIGRPTKRTPEVVAEILRALRSGCDYQTAAMGVRIHVDTLHEWRKADASFSGDCEKAIAEGRVEMAELAQDIARGDAPAKGVAACIFWLKTRTTEFRERADLTPESADAVAEKVREALRREIPPSDFEDDGGKAA